jgi:hypothetical protein
MYPTIKSVEAYSKIVPQSKGEQQLKESGKSGSKKSQTSL